jgi:DNA-binding CsgD family transcriptional regulator
MDLGLAEALADKLVGATTNDELHERMAASTHDLGFDHFALSVEIGFGSGSGTSVLIHDYPTGWADIYIGFNLAATDPIRRAAERSLRGFDWAEIATLIPLTSGERTMLDIGQRQGIANGFTIPRHLPGELTGSCTFVTRPDGRTPDGCSFFAEVIGAVAIERGRRLAGWGGQAGRIKLTDRQRDCVLWAARGKTDWEISRILGISQDTVIQHLKDARERYDTRKRASLVLYALFDGLISFADVFRYRSG